VGFALFGADLAGAFALDFEPAGFFAAFEPAAARALSVADFGIRPSPSSADPVARGDG
jgi:hypothetical protein